MKLQKSLRGITRHSDLIVVYGVVYFTIYATYMFRFRVLECNDDGAEELVKQVVSAELVFFHSEK